MLCTPAGSKLLWGPFLFPTQPQGAPEPPTLAPSGKPYLIQSEFWTAS